MKTRFSWTIAMLGTASAFACFQAAAAGAEAAGRAPAVNELQRQNADSDRFGSPAGGMPYDVAIRLCADTKSVSVRRLDTVQFVTPEGREFRWRFDTTNWVDVFPLARIAPTGVSVPANTTVYVNPEIPISP